MSRVLDSFTALATALSLGLLLPACSSPASNTGAGGAANGGGGATSNSSGGTNSGSGGTSSGSGGTPGWCDASTQLAGETPSTGGTTNEWDFGSMQERINTLRKTKVLVRVVDGEGNPVEGATVDLDMVQHEFLFGSEASPRDLFDDANPTARDTFTEKFLGAGLNVSTFGNDLKWIYYNEAQAKKGVAWMNAHDIHYRGHAIIRASFQRAPQAISDGYAANGAAWLENEVMTTRIEPVTKAFKGQFIHWDVVNEPKGHHDLADAIGSHSWYTWFKKAKELDPSCKLYLTETGVGFAPVERLNKDQRLGGVYAVTHSIKDNMKPGEAPPVDVFGFQGHFVPGNMAETIEDKWNRLEKVINFDLIGEWNLDFGFVEYDFNPKDDTSITDQDEADFLEEWLRIVFSHPRAQMFMMWGIWDPGSWISNAPLYDANWNLKPSGQTWMDLVKGEWWTDVSAQTNECGQAEASVFKGTHFLSVTVNGKKASRLAKLTDGVGELVLTLGQEDSDQDWIADSWELTQFGNLTTADRNVDANANGTLEVEEYGYTDYDNDGASDLDEFTNGSDPKSSSSK